MSEYTGALCDDGVAIFLFHGVIRSVDYEVRNYTRKHLTARRFGTVLDELCAKGTPVSVADLVAASDVGRPLPPRAFILTFDDGFENNYSVAAPKLEQRRIPAVFYVTTDFIAENRSSWIDLIEHAFESRADVSVVWGDAAERTSYRGPVEKRKALDEIRAFVKARREVDPYELAESVCTQLEITDAPADKQLDQKMSWSQVRELSETALFTIGGHGHSHRILEFLDQSELEREIAQSLELLRYHVATPILHYSYPEGLSHCYSPRVVSLLRQQGIRCAPTAEPGINHVGDDLFRLKRLAVV
ncbi:MAG TPA: polysaccharide deacetylase family protein [Acidobacteriota bacterium]|nr:polysaccharide deacetylase family protein [Acidobacteriota bacterium]